MALLAYISLITCIAALITWIGVGTARAFSRSRGPRPAGRASLESRLQLITFVALGATCLTMLALGGMSGARWSFFMLIALPLVGVDVWATVRLLLHERRGNRREWPPLHPRPGPPPG